MKKRKGLIWYVCVYVFVKEFFFLTFGLISSNFINLPLQFSKIKSLLSLILLPFHITDLLFVEVTI